MKSQIELSGYDTMEELPTVDTSNLPTIITNNVEKLNELSNSVIKAMDAAEKVNKSAKEASKKSAGFWNRKIAIEELQEATRDIAHAVEINAEAQMLSFEFQTKLAEITRYLLGLGISNMANNRVVVRELEKRLQGASEEEISELAKQEIMQVIMQLKGQEDILSKLNQQTENIKLLKERLIHQIEYSKQVNERFYEQKFNIEQLDEKIDQLNDNIKFENLIVKTAKHSDDIKYQQEMNTKFEYQLTEVNKTLNPLEQLTIQLDNQLNELKDSLKSHELVLQSHENTHSIINMKLAEIIKTNEYNELKVNKLQSEVNHLKELLIKKSNFRFTVLTLVIASIGVVLAVIGLLL